MRRNIKSIYLVLLVITAIGLIGYSFVSSKKTTKDNAMELLNTEESNTESMIAVESTEEVVESTEEYTDESEDTSAEDMNIKEQTGYIFIGDSRFVEMDMVCNLSELENIFVIAKVSEGYKYLVNTALPEAESIIENNTDITHWKYVIGLGVNDLYNVDRYIETYDELKETVDLVVLSVNPVEYSTTESNEDIVKFNDKVKEVSGIQYVNMYDTLMENGFSTTDGVHYTKGTYEYIYTLIGRSLYYE